MQDIKNVLEWFTVVIDQIWRKQKAEHCYKYVIIWYSTRFDFEIFQFLSSVRFDFLAAKLKTGL